MISEVRLATALGLKSARSTICFICLAHKETEMFWNFLTQWGVYLIFTRMSQICTVNLTDPSSYKMCLPDLNEYYNTSQFFVSLPTFRVQGQCSGSNSWKIKRNLFFFLISFGFMSFEALLLTVYSYKIIKSSGLTDAFII